MPERRPIMMTMEWDGVTPEQYDAARDLVGWERNPPTGGMFHVAAFGDNRLRITDVWETEQDFQNFVETRLMPGVRQLGIQGAPRVEMFPAHRIFTPGYTPTRR